VTRPSPIEAALRRHRLADVARRTGITLPTDTGSVTVRCPPPSHGHPECTPSLRLYLDDDRYHCFGCSAKGDVIQWARDTEGVGVHKAIRVLDSGASLVNARAGATPTARRMATTAAGSGRPALLRAGTSPERLHAAINAAWAVLTSPALHAAGVAYLAGRGVNIEAIEEHNERFEVGCTPTSPSGITELLLGVGFTIDELLDVGISHQGRATDRPVDMFRWRVVLPVREGDGAVCGLIGRSVNGSGPKYLNSPRTDIYDKSVHLYRPLRVRGTPAAHAVVVEGTIDALALAAAAIATSSTNRICPLTQSGRELSPRQVSEILFQHRGRPVLMLDGDTAGREAMTRLTRAFTSAGRPPVQVDLPSGEDPASWLCQRHPSNLGQLLDHPRPVVAPRPRRPAPLAEPAGAPNAISC
jgi:DNA primase